MIKKNYYWVFIMKTEVINMIKNKSVEDISNFIIELMREKSPIQIDPEIRKGTKELDEMINSYYWNSEKSRAR